MMFEPTWSVSRSVEPASLPLTRAQAKAHCTVADEITDDDALFDGYLAVAPDVVELLSEHALLPQTWIQFGSGFPAAREAIVLRRPPLRAVASIQYRDPAGALQTWSPSKYREITSGRFGQIVPVVGECYPPTSCDPDAVTITFTCGYDDATKIPARYLMAHRLLVAHWYANREPVVVGTITSNLPLGLETVIGAPARVDPCW
jgi:uncharacterized phiE125 gp8 family phage protein